MSTTQKIAACIAIAVLWLLAIIATHFFPDVKDQILQYTSACNLALIGLGAYHAGKSSQGASQ